LAPFIRDNIDDVAETLASTTATILDQNRILIEEGTSNFVRAVLEALGVDSNTIDSINITITNRIDDYIDDIQDPETDQSKDLVSFFSDVIPVLSYDIQYTFFGQGTFLASIVNMLMGFLVYLFEIVDLVIPIKGSVGSNSTMPVNEVSSTLSQFYQSQFILEQDVEISILEATVASPIVLSPSIFIELLLEKLVGKTTWETLLKPIYESLVGDFFDKYFSPESTVNMSLAWVEPNTNGEYSSVPNYTESVPVRIRYDDTADQVQSGYTRSVALMEPLKLKAGTAVAIRVGSNNVDVEDNLPILASYSAVVY
jgi:hypothetical protein